MKCPYCQEQFDFPGIFQEDKNGKTGETSGLICCKCTGKLPEQYVMNRVNLFLKQLIALYYSGTYECQEPACKARSRQPLINGRCIVMTCKGKMIPEYSEFATNDTLRYLQGLFNVMKYIHENKEQKKEEDIPFYIQYAELKAKVDFVMNRSKYNKVDLKNIFAFMSKN
jgi:DNA Polymerase alpha zinc finger